MLPVRDSPQRETEDAAVGDAVKHNLNEQTLRPFSSPDRSAGLLYNCEFLINLWL